MPYQKYHLFWLFAAQSLGRMSVWSTLASSPPFSVSPVSISKSWLLVGFQILPLFCSCLGGEEICQVFLADCIYYASLRSCSRTITFFFGGGYSWLIPLVENHMCPLCFDLLKRGFVWEAALPERQDKHSQFTSLTWRKCQNKDILIEMQRMQCGKSTSYLFFIFRQKYF